jgi:hypothetical protein
MAVKKPSFPSRPCPKCQKPIHIKSKKHEECGWRAENSAGVTNGSKSAAPSVGVGGESTAGYFRKIFKAQPRLLGERSNEKLLNQWLLDHPGYTVVPDNVKSNLSNLKSVLRSKKRKKVAKGSMEPQANTPLAVAPAPVARKATGSGKLEGLEFQIDECLILAKELDREGLQDIIGLLRRARNAVVWMIGQ